MVDAPRCVEARPQAEANSSGIDLSAAQAGVRHEGGDTWAGRAIYRFQAAPHQRAVLVQQRHQVGNRPESYQVDQ